MRNFTELYRMDLPHRAISVYIYLADRANKDGICWPSIPTISKDIKLSEYGQHLVRILTKRDQKIHEHCYQESPEYQFFWGKAVSAYTANDLACAVCDKTSGEGQRKHAL